MPKVRFILHTLGSAGDVHPFVALGCELSRRGHHVVVLTNPVFESLVRERGLTFAPIGSRKELHRVGTDPRIHQRRHAWKLAVQWAAIEPMRETFDKIRQRHLPGRTVLVSAVLGFGARIANEVLGIPLATCVIDPDKLRGLDQPPKLPPLWLGRPIPRWSRALQYWIADRMFIDPLFAPEVNRFRAEFGLPPVDRLLHRWWLGADRLIGLFDSWYAPASRDWPDNLDLVGPTLWDPEPDPAAWERARAFLDAGSPPILFVPGSAGADARRFMTTAVEVCRRLDSRGILLHGRPHLVPEGLPASVMHLAYLPLKRLAPRCAAIVHHGGSGTALQAIAAGIPQVVCPRAFNQFDTAARLTRLGVGRTVPPARFRPGAATTALGSLLRDPRVEARCRDLASRLAGRDGVSAACDILERMVGLDAPGVRTDPGRSEDRHPTPPRPARRIRLERGS